MRAGVLALAVVGCHASDHKDRVFVAATNIGGDEAASAVDAVFGPLIERYAK